MGDILAGLIPFLGILGFIFLPKILNKRKSLNVVHKEKQQNLIKEVKQTQQEEVELVVKAKNSENLSNDKKIEINKTVIKANENIKKILAETDGRKSKSDFVNNW